jgi:ABC-type phosphate/phosphonate transport system substrate-binding protein
MKYTSSRLWLFVVLTLSMFGTARAELILSSAPRDSKEKEEAIFQPITALLSKATGEKVTFRYGDNFLVYQSEMRKGSYDIVLDGPAFVSWRMTKLQHVPFVKFPGNLVFVAIAKSDNKKADTLKDLAGRTICAFPPPNLATMTVLYEFDNPARQPLVIETQSFQDSYKGVMSGKCMGGIMQAKLFKDMDKDSKGKVLFTSKPLPNQAFSAGPRVTPENRAKMTQALLSPEGAAATQNLREAFKIQALEPATMEEYQGLAKLLRDVWGFGL